MKRTLSLVLALVMVLGTFTMAFAEMTDAEMEDGAILKDLGVLTGSESGDLMLDRALTRQEAVVLISRLMGEEELASNFPVEEAYPDEESDFYSPYLAWAKANGTFTGNAEGNFQPTETITTKQFAKVLLTVLGYEQDVDFTFDESLEMAVELGFMPEGVEEVVMTRGTMAVVTVAVLSVNSKDADVTLAEKLGLELPEPPAPTALEVEEVVADNLKEVKVMFNQMVDADTVVDANVVVSGKTGSVALMEDGMTAVITMDAALENQKEYTLVVEKVKTTGDLEIEKTEMKFTAFDATLPTALSVEVTGPRNLTVTFSEPMNDAVMGTVAIKQDKVNLGSTVEVSGSKVSIKAYTDFVEGKEYTVTVNGFEDYAGYKNVIKTLTFTYAKDVNPPVASVDKAEQTYVVVSFDKPVTGLSKDKFYHTFSAWEAQKIEDLGNNKVKVYFIDENGDGRAIPAGETLFGIRGTAIKDNWGNALGNQEFTISTTADRTLPEVKSIVVKSEETLEVTFTKDVTFKTKNVEILDADGKKISGVYVTVSPDEVGKKFTVDFGKNLAGKTVTVNIKDVEDNSLYKNVLSLHTEVVEITDKTEPGINAVYYNTDKDDDKYTGQLYVAFDEAVDAATALVDTNYSLVYGVGAGSEVKVLSGASLSFDVVNSRVKINLTAAQAEKLHDNLVAVNMQVINVKDLAGNVIMPMQTALTDLDVTKTVTYTVTATKRNQLVVEFSDLISNVKLGDFNVNGKGLGTGFTLTQNDSSTKTTLTFDLADKVVKTDGSDMSFVIVNDANHEIKNSYGSDAEFTVNNVVVDEIMPEIAMRDTLVAGVKEKDITVTNNAYGIEIKFTETMDPNTFSSLSFKVDGKVVTKAELINGLEFGTVTLTLNTAIEENKYVRISYVYDVMDEKGNALNLDKGVFYDKKYEIQ